MKEVSNDLSTSSIVRLIKKEAVMTKEKAKRNPRPCPVCGEIIPGHLKFDHIKLEHPELQLGQRIEHDRKGKKRNQLYCVVCDKPVTYRTAKNHINCRGVQTASKAYTKVKSRKEAEIETILDRMLEGVADDIAREVLATLTLALDEAIHNLETGEPMYSYRQLKEENERLRAGLDEIAESIRMFGAMVD